jgi:hypothetical protein
MVTSDCEGEKKSPQPTKKFYREKSKTTAHP